MSQQANSPKTFVAGEALSAWRRVKISGSTVVYADAGERGIGVTQVAVASGDNVPVRLFTHGGTFKVEAGAAITAAASIYGANDGKMSTSVSGSILGQAIEAASGSGSIFEAIMIPGT